MLEVAVLCDYDDDDEDDDEEEEEEEECGCGQRATTEEEITQIHRCLSSCSQCSVYVCMYSKLDFGILDFKNQSKSPYGTRNEDNNI
jgi:hypothetical protein